MRLGVFVFLAIISLLITACDQSDNSGQALSCKNQVVTISDPAFGEALRNAFDEPKVSLNDCDLETLVEVRAFALGIRDLSGIEHLKNLKVLDVFNNEPDINPRYRKLENTFLLPHVGSATRETRDAMGFRALDNLDAIFAGQEPRDRVA